MLKQKNAAKLVYLLILLLVIGWNIAIIVPSYCESNGSYLSAFLVRKIFSYICHQKTERSFFIWNAPLAVCARCSGIYIGLLIGSLFYPLIRSYQDTNSPPRIYLIIAFLPTTLDFSLGMLHILENTHFSRALTGLIAGIGLAFYLIPAIVNLFEELNLWFRNQ
jgi:uncharacterized membrane protein